MENTENKTGKTPDSKKDKKPSKLLPKTPKFSYYWIYAVIAVLLITFQIFSFNSSLETVDVGKFQEQMLKSHDVEKLVVVNNKIAEVYIKEEALKNEKYKDVKSNAWGGTNKGPHYQIKFGDLAYFQQQMDEVQKDF